ncbi:unnamed protein product [Rotaria sordida]|uniref:Uncharacterized protein n=1 Tax=Rotaria sordida TaxID=392033 RepID=A0A815NPB7_9BILA|nr:unnamed protein product [Rotaria sordida]CAF4071771.1 unnamed protein product [Rotaria sordida]
MTSSTPSRSIDFDPSLPENRIRSLSLSSSPEVSQSVARKISSRRSQTPKAKRKNISNRLKPYTPFSLSHTNQLKNSTKRTAHNSQELNNTDESSVDINVIRLSSQQNQTGQVQDAFERSSEDETEVSNFNIIYLISLGI